MYACKAGVCMGRPTQIHEPDSGSCPSSGGGWLLLTTVWGASSGYVEGNINVVNGDLHFTATWADDHAGTAHGQHQCAAPTRKGHTSSSP